MLSAALNSGVALIRAYASAVDDEERKIDAQQQQTP
jgi:hypothetical protein